MTFFNLFLPSLLLSDEDLVFGYSVAMTTARLSLGVTAICRQTLPSFADNVLAVRSLTFDLTFKVQTASIEMLINSKVSIQGRKKNTQTIQSLRRMLTAQSSFHSTLL